ncbi:MAG: hypothetical protein HY717_10300 [Planctomycetes bacterium]|nr:hypothetical protein [Planctomycetota bacterium]
MPLSAVGKIRALCAREVLPLAGGHTGVLLLLGVLILHLKVALSGPDAEGHLFSRDVLAEAFLQSFLVCAPLVAFYAGLRSALRERDRFLPYVAIAGAGFLSLLTLVGLCLM